MAWVVDTCLIIDLAMNDQDFALISSSLLQSKAGEGLVICPVSYVELAPAFNGDRAMQDFFLFNLGIATDHAWTLDDTNTAHAAWNRHRAMRAANQVGKRPIADVLIGAFACRYDGLLTRNEQDFRKLFPELKIRVP